ncbi:MAG: Rpn family recombination-promoting nuclease/putative transposase [Cytophagales bacterium]
MLFADVKNDIAFRKIFGNENKKIILVSFLNAILKLEGSKRITDLSINNPFQLPLVHSLKATIIDVKVTDIAGNQYIIEMQVADVFGLEKRLQYYLAKGYTSQIEKDDDYERLNPIIFIGIFDFAFSKNTSYISKHITIDTETGENLFKDFEFNLIELPKFNKKETELGSIIDKWIYFIKNAENLTILPENIEDEGLKAAYESAQIFTWTKQEMEEYDYAAMREGDDRNRLVKAVMKGKIEGKIEGKLEGKLEIAKELLKNKISIEIIEKATGLSREEIEKLK